MKTVPITLLKLLGVAIFYGAIGFGLYRQRGIGESAVWSSDFLVFYVPALFALFANGWITGASLPAKWHPGIKAAISSLVAILLTLFVLGSYLTVAINLYGA